VQPQLFREVIAMCDMNGSSYREITAAIRATQGAEMSKLARKSVAYRPAWEPK
jgi:DNA-directed RNA polymerase specialized sigma24 family protein